MIALLNAEKLLSEMRSDDYERYTKMGLQIEPNSPLFLNARGEGLDAKQLYTPWSEKDYSYIDCFRKAYENLTVKNPDHLHRLRDAEARREYWSGSLRQLNHLIQLTTPNLDLKEARCEIYKISISFESTSEFI